MIKMTNYRKLSVNEIGRRVLHRLRMRRCTYLGYHLYYSTGTSLIARIQKGKNYYEPELSRRLIATLAAAPDPVFLDIGANIGLITLNVLKAVPTVHVYAFEPGPHQNALLRQTILNNQLSKRVDVVDAALGRENMNRPFSVHRHRDASGDGFFDTRRAGPSTSINVECKTLDRWWSENGSPRITTVKIDTEGAELWILQGAARVIEECRPDFLLEIWPANLSPYPYNETDVIDMLSTYKYQLRTLDGERVTRENRARFIGHHESFMARPVERC